MGEKIKQFAKMHRQNYLLTTVTFSMFSILTGFIFTVYNGVLGAVYRSLWSGSICVYYLMLTGIRATVVYSQFREMLLHRERRAAHRRKVYIATHMALILMNISLIVPAAVMVAGGRSYTYGLIPAIAMAAYTTYRITMSIVHFKRSRRSSNILTAELRTLNMIDSLVAVLTLQNALIIANGGMNGSMQTLSAWTSAGILFVIVVITVCSLLLIRPKPPARQAK